MFLFRWVFLVSAIETPAEQIVAPTFTARFTPLWGCMNRDEAVLIFTDCKRAYQILFNSEAGKAVLADLNPFCRANETCVVPGDRDRTYVLEGRREVWLRIQDYLTLTPEQLVERFTRPAKGAISHDDRTEHQS